MRICPKCGATNIGTSYCPLCEPEKIPVIKDKEMSVKELRFEDKHKNTKCIIDKGNSDFKILIIDCCHTEFYLDRNQAHLLMLYLQEHLGYKPAMQNYKESWYCDKCKIYHSKDHTCVRIGT